VDGSRFARPASGSRVAPSWELPARSRLPFSRWSRALGGPGTGPLGADRPANVLAVPLHSSLQEGGFTMLKTLAMATTLAALLGAPVDVPATELAAVTSERHDASLDRTTGAAHGPYSVIQGTIASSDRNGIELVL